MLLVQEFLKTHSFQELANQHGVYVTFDSRGHKFSLNYDMIEAKDDDKIAQECRGLILARQDGQAMLQDLSKLKKLEDYGDKVPGETQVVAFGFKRFFNHGQDAAKTINWADPDLTILEKLDGTLIQLYFDPIIKEWHTSTRSVPEANILMDGGRYTFRTLFEKALQDTNGMSFAEFTEKLNQNVTYCFELTTPYNRIVVKYDNCSITLLGARSRVDLQEIRVDNLRTFLDPNIHVYGIPCVKAFRYSSIEELVDWVSTLDPLQQEGVVAMDSNFNRVKVKSAAYVLFNKCRDTLSNSPRNCLELILQEKDDDAIPFMPADIVEDLIRIKNGYVKFLKEHDEIFQNLLQKANEEKAGDRKTFALLVNQQKEIWAAPMFQLFQQKCEDMKGFIDLNKKHGSWSAGFLDSILGFINASH